MQRTPRGRFDVACASRNWPRNSKVPPLPPHITYEQAKSYAQALLKGDPEALGLVWQSVKEGIQGILPSRHGMRYPAFSPYNIGLPPVTGTTAPEM
jgi:hypothetical protein